LFDVRTNESSILHIIYPLKRLANRSLKYCMKLTKNDRQIGFLSLAVVVAIVVCIDADVAVVVSRVIFAPY